MELVTLAEVALHRAGSASSLGVVSDRTVAGTYEVADEAVDTLRELVLRIAEKHGDSRESLKTMTQELAYHYTPVQGAVVFNIQARNVFYSTPYATCVAFPALRINGRYFKLDETSGPRAD
jgi:hypothetical protein